MSASEPHTEVDGRTRRPGQVPLQIWALLITLFLSAFAIVGQITIVGKQVFDMTGDELDLGLLGLAEFIAIALLAPFAGSVADRKDRRRVFAAALVLEALVSVGLFLYSESDPTSVTPIFGLVLVFGAARAFAAPSSRALPIDLAPPDVLERVVALKSVMFQAGAITGPVVFGFAFVIDESLPYLIAAGAFLAAIAMLALVESPPIRQLKTSGARQAVRDALQGLRFVRRQPIVFGAITLDLFAVLFGGVIALLPAIAEDLDVGAVGLGWLRAAVGLGAVVVALFLSIRPLRRNIGRVLMAVVAVFGVMTIIIGLSDKFAVVFVALMIAAGADAVSVFIRITLVPLATPEQMRGRVLAVENVFIGASNELGAVESGLTAAAFGLTGAVIFGGVGTLVVVALWWRFFPALRNVDSFAEVREGGEAAARSMGLDDP
ncbi:MAG: MFS transporter [Acidimicrobiales bacterium]